MKRPKVYLAGKITKNGWRNQIVPRPDWFDGNSHEPWGDDSWPSSAPSAWTVRVGDRYDITGPFFVRDDHGCTHGQSSHAQVGGCVGDLGDKFDPDHLAIARARNRVRRLCLDAIRRSDFVFAWLDDSTAYGTLTEIGYAAALGKRVLVFAPHCTGVRWLGDSSGMDYQRVECCAFHGEMWFAAGIDFFEWESDPVTAFHMCIDSWHRNSREFDSEVERLFWEAHESLGRPIPDLDSQWDIKAKGKQYRLDFYSPAARAAIEVDGLAHHNGQESFIADRNRQRDLEMEGVRFLRFAAKEVMVDPEACVRQAAEWHRKLIAT